MTETQEQMEIYPSTVNIIHSAPDCITQRIGTPDGFFPIKTISTSTATPQDDILNNVINNIKLEIPGFHEHREFRKIKPKEAKIAIVGGAPSIKSQLTKLFLEYDVIIAAGSSYDFLVKNGVIPTYAAACDADPIVNNYYQLKNNNTEFLIASCCDKKVFDHLSDQKVYMWNCYSDTLLDWFNENVPGAHLIGGGCTVGLRSINLAIMMGYTNIHLFGMDSCLSDNESHAYEFVEEKEKDGMGQVYSIKIGPDSDKVYKVLGYQLAQAEHFREFLVSYHNMVTFTIHGESFLKDVYKDFLEANKDILNGI